MNHDKLLIELIKNQDIPALYRVGRKQGFISNLYRKQIYPLIMELNQPKVPYAWFQPIEKCEQNDQLIKDVQRSMNTIDVFQQLKDKQQENRSKLMDILDSLFLDLPDYKYYQGYHDIVTIFMLILGTEMGYQASKKAADLYFKDYLKFNFDVTVIPQLEIIKQLLKQYAIDSSDSKFHDLIVNIPMLNFPIPWILTWFSHSLEKFYEVARIWDYLICSSQNAILYVASAFIIYHKNNFLTASDNFEIVISIFYYFLFLKQMTEMQFFFQQLEKQENNIEYILNLSTQLQQKYPFEQFVQNKPIQILNEYHINIKI